MIGEWKELPIAIQGLGVICNYLGFYRRNINSLEVRMFFTSGTPIASLFKIFLPENFIIDLREFENKEHFFVSFGQINSPLQNRPLSIKSKHGNRFVTVEDLNGNSISNCGDNMYCFFNIPIMEKN